MSDIYVDLYARVSTNLQAEEGYSLQEQEYRLRLYAEAQGWKVHQVYLDGGFSGASLDRPGIQSVIRDVESGLVQKVITYKLDRLSRSQKDTLYLIEDIFIANKVDFVSLTESLDTGTPLGKAMIGILAVFAQLEREEIAERMMMGRVASAKEGNWHGGQYAPIGYRYIPRTNTEDGKLVVDEYEAALVKQVFSLFLLGKNFHAIQEHMRSTGLSTQYGLLFGGGSSRVVNMLENRIYIGEVSYQGVWYDGKHEPIIDRETFARVQDKLAVYKAQLANKRRQPYAGVSLLSGLIYCKECGAKYGHTFHRYKTAAGEEAIHEYYRCYTRAKSKTMRRGDYCAQHPWRANELEEIVWEQVESLRFDEVAHDQKKADSPITAYEERIAEIDRQLERLIQLFSLGSIPFDSIQKRSAELSLEKEQLRDAIAVESKKSNRLTREEVESAVKRVIETRASKDKEAQRDILTMLISKITVSDDSVEIAWNI